MKSTILTEEIVCKKLSNPGDSFLTLINQFPAADIVIPPRNARDTPNAGGVSISFKMS